MEITVLLAVWHVIKDRATGIQLGKGYVRSTEYSGICANVIWRLHGAILQLR